ncbi:hypothetical protein B0H17DRAFT_1133606 [Mycena rosella]|uniref:Uncharacterized protein n=1 Tax=Mycena rosella TaxID=1033263 RepID=A0AAD7GJC4_MYCRO|nr:hypothetical protein B0H17DRAFT_1133606 [Mycena rosella]
MAVTGKHVNSKFPVGVEDYSNRPLVLGSAAANPSHSSCFHCHQASSKHAPGPPPAPPAGTTCPTPHASPRCHYVCHAALDQHMRKHPQRALVEPQQFQHVLDDDFGPELRGAAGGIAERNLLTTSFHTARKPVMGSLAVVSMRTRMRTPQMIPRRYTGQLVFHDDQVHAAPTQGRR